MGSFHEELFSTVDIGMSVWESRGSRLVVAGANDAARELLARPLNAGEAAERVLEHPRLLLCLVEVLADQQPIVVDGISHAGRTLQARAHPLPEGRVGLVLIEVPDRHNERADAVAALGTRDEFLTNLTLELERSRLDDTRLAVVVLDLDRFKEVNDTLGHSQGDALLGQVGRRLSQLGAGTWAACRVGGDEFALLARPTVQPLDALAAQIATTFAAPFQLGRLSIRATASLGVAAWPDHGDEPEDLLRKADVAMWSAKQSGRGVAVYREEDDRYNLRRVTLVADLRDAITAGDLTLHYQPKLDIASGQVVGAEALVRWTHPIYGEVSPGEFVPMAEEHALIGPLSHWVLGEAGRQARAWQRIGLPIDVSANISARNLYDPRLVQWLTHVIDINRLAPGQLTLELTETQVAEDLPMARQILRRLQSLGADLSIDDFGTGYSSLSYLSKLPLDELKIDRSFVLDLGSEHGDALVQTIIGLGHELGLRVVAEGVESTAALDTLEDLGCDVVQGHHLSCPLPSGQFEDWFAARV